MRVKSSEKDFAQAMIKELNQKIKIIFESSKFSDQIKIEGCRIIFRLIQIFKDTLINDKAVSGQFRPRSRRSSSQQR